MVKVPGAVSSRLPEASKKAALKLPRRALHVAVLLAAAGCSRSGSPKEKAPQFRARQEIQAASATKEVGEDCTANGASACKSGICMHVKPHPLEGYVCSRGCTSDGDCLAGWGCKSVSVTASNRFCLPPDPAAATLSALAAAQTAAAAAQGVSGQQSLLADGGVGLTSALDAGLAQSPGTP